MEGNKNPPKYTFGNNYRRYRKETKFDTLDTAKDLKRKIAKYVMNERYVPKRWRYFEGQPAVDYARKIRDCVSRANDVLLDDKNPDAEQVKKRLEMEQIALSYCNVLQLQLDDIIEECQGATHENMREITDTLDSLIGMIIKWNKSDCERLGT